MPFTNPFSALSLISQKWHDLAQLIVYQGCMSLLHCNYNSIQALVN